MVIYIVIFSLETLINVINNEKYSSAITLELLQFIIINRRLIAVIIASWIAVDWYIIFKFYI